MPCRDESHNHRWPKAGTLTLCKCEIFCGYCEGEDAKKVHTLQWELRHHVRVVHTGSEGLDVRVSPRSMPHMAINPKKRNHAEVEQDDSDDSDEDSDEAESSEEEVKATSDESSEEGSKKLKPLMVHSRAPSDPFVNADKKDTKSAPTPLRLRAKAVAMPKKVPLSTHAASFKPIGPKAGPSSPKRARQETSAGPPPPVTRRMVSGPPPRALEVRQGMVQAGSVTNGPLVNSVLSEQQRAFVVARNAAEVQASMNAQRPLGNPQQMPSNGPPQPQGRNNIGPPINAQPRQMPSQLHSRLVNVIPPPLQLSTSDQDFYRRNSAFPEQHHDMPPELLRIRHLTQDLLTNHNASELLLINMYTTEIEFIRQLQTRRWISNAHGQGYIGSVQHAHWLAQQQLQQQLSPQMMQQLVGGYVHGHLMLTSRPGLGQGGQQPYPQQQACQQFAPHPMHPMGVQQAGQGQQVGGQQYQQPVQRQVSGGHQPGLQQQGALQFASRPMQQMSVQHPSQVQQLGGPQPQQTAQRQVSAGQQLGPQRQVSGGQQFAPHQVSTGQQPNLQRQASGGQQSGVQQRFVQPQTFAGQQLVVQQVNPQRSGPQQPSPQQLGLQQLAPRPHAPRPLPSPQKFGPWLPDQQRLPQQKSASQAQDHAQEAPQQVSQQVPQPAVNQLTEPQQHHSTHLDGQLMPRDQSQEKVDEQTKGQIATTEEEKPDAEKSIKEETV
ncbi:hypothetical protein D6C78_10114 [Aureobasidium pullulans]|uniref:Uncharacterized protein n=1 Tax=Aureobasidium pullulans TaxID=5580 RepID=A0A4T0B7R1_AURPU|nr:hypothetical protein D6C78_10114 [Aureobasidium pullulans]